MNQPLAKHSIKLGLAIVVLLAGCAPTPPPTVTPTSTPSPSSTSTATPTPPTLTPTAAALQAVPTDTPTVTATPQVRRADALPTRTVTPTPLPGDTSVPGLACVVSATNLNLREGPSTGHRVVVTLPSGSNLTARKRVADTSWLLVSTPAQTIGWVYAPLIDCSGVTTTLPLALGVVALAPATATPPPVTPTATPSPPAAVAPPPDIPLNRWRGEYYDNASLLGEPVFIREDADLNFNWILDSPDPRIPADNFSVRWTGQFFFPEAADYRFFANADDGVRLYVDGWRIIDSWETSIPVDRFGTFADVSPGWHTVVVEYFESGGYARIHVWAETTVLTSSTWSGEYFANRDLQDPAAFYRDANTIDFDWGNGSPDDSKLNPDFFSVRWKRTLPMTFGNYKFFVETKKDDWVRVKVDGWTVIEDFREDGGRIESDFANMGGGDVTIIVEYQEHGGRAGIKFWWEKQ